jgi:ribonuclease HII
MDMQNGSQEEKKPRGLKKNLESAAAVEYDRAIRQDGPNIRQDGISLLCGVDEAGRGPLAGPVFAAAVILDPERIPEGLNDSKKLTEKKREALFDEICRMALAYSVASASVEEIDRLNILQATFLAMGRAVEGLSVKPQLVLIDGNAVPPQITLPARAVVKGDALSATIAAASILAKVSRDRLMLELDQEYPQYYFWKHKGYGTALHYEMLEQHGISPVHRRSFLKKLL